MHMKGQVVPKPSSFCIQSPIKNFNKDTKVMEFIDAGSGSQKKEVERGTLNNEKANLVCSIPISLAGLQDKLIWGHTKTRIFFVRTAYHLDMCRRKMAKDDSSRTISGREGWKAL